MWEYVIAIDINRFVSYLPCAKYFPLLASLDKQLLCSNWKISTFSQQQDCVWIVCIRAPNSAKYIKFANTWGRAFSSKLPVLSFTQRLKIKMTCYIYSIYILYDSVMQSARARSPFLPSSIHTDVDELNRCIIITIIIIIIYNLHIDLFILIPYANYSAI